MQEPAWIPEGFETMNFEVGVDIMKRGERESGKFGEERKTDARAPFVDAFESEINRSETFRAFGDHREDVPGFEWAVGLDGLHDLEVPYRVIIPYFSGKVKEKVQKNENNFGRN
jgi:hypothetical protein